MHRPYHRTTKSESWVVHGKVLKSSFWTLARFGNCWIRHVDPGLNKVNFLFSVCPLPAARDHHISHTYPLSRFPSTIPVHPAHARTHARSHTYTLVVLISLLAQDAFSRASLWPTPQLCPTWRTFLDLFPSKTDPFVIPQVPATC